MFVCNCVRECWVMHWWIGMNFNIILRSSCYIISSNLNIILVIHSLIQYYTLIDWEFPILTNYHIALHSIHSPNSILPYISHRVYIYIHYYYRSQQPKHRPQSLSRRIQILLRDAKPSPSEINVPARNVRHHYWNPRYGSIKIPQRIWMDERSPPLVSRGNPEQTWNGGEIHWKPLLIFGSFDHCRILPHHLCKFGDLPAHIGRPQCQLFWADDEECVLVQHRKRMFWDREEQGHSRMFWWGNGVFSI